MSCLRRTYVGTFVLSRNGIIVPQARDTSITPNAPFRGCLARNPPLCATPFHFSLYYSILDAPRSFDAYNSCLDAYPGKNYDATGVNYDRRLREIRGGKGTRRKKDWRKGGESSRVDSHCKSRVVI